MFLQPTPGQQFFTVRCSSPQALRWLIEDLTDLSPSFGAEQWDDGTAMVIVVDASLGARQRMERYGSIVSWRCKLDVTGEYTSYGLEAQGNGTHP